MRSPCLRDPLRGRAAAALAVVGALWLGGAGCGLVSSDIDDFDLSIEEKSFTIDTSQWGLTDVDTFVNTDCSATPGVCATAAQQACTDGNCFGSCSTTTNTCELHVVVALWDMVVLTEEQPELQTIDDSPLVGVTIDTIEYAVAENSLNVATPPFTLYVSPSTIMSPGDPEAEAVGTIAPVDARTLLPLTPVDITDAGRASLTDYMTNFSTPFNIIVGADLYIRQGDTVPQGRMSAKVKVAAHADASL
ncbi:MAG: hypothetical protein H6708_25890 [Kofleriaceae bacterium]|nr:hypothetical protein [Kofleriaceae bacterium]